jgi:hypothetical protein
MNWEEDTEFLNLMGLKDLQNAGLSSGAGDFGVGSVGGLEDLDGVGGGAVAGGGLYDG